MSAETTLSASVTNVYMSTLAARIALVAQQVDAAVETGISWGKGQCIVACHPQCWCQISALTLQWVRL